MQERSTHRRGRGLLAAGIALAMVAAACSDGGDDADGTAESTPPPTAAPETSAESGSDTTVATTEPAPATTDDRAFYILPPGNYGGIPVNDDSLDQLPLYDALTPLRGDVTDDDLSSLFLPQDFAPIGATTEEPTGRPGTTIVYDEFGVAHITGETRDDLAFGAGWVTARDRALLLELGRGPARVAVADVPGIDAFSLVTSAQTFVPSAATEQLVTDQVQLLVDTYGAEGEEIIADAQAYVDGVNAYREASGVEGEPFTVNDVVAVTAFIGSIFGAGGGSEARNAEFLSSLQGSLGDEQGRQVWEDFMPYDDPESPTTLEERFDYGALTGGEVTGSVVIDAGSVVSLEVVPSESDASADTEVQGARAPSAADSAVGAAYPAADGPVRRQASNWLLVDPSASENATAMGVMGPQLGYYYPEIVQQIHLSGPGIEAQGAAVPGLAMYLLIGRTEDYAWSLTSASQDVRDVYAELLCEPSGAEPTVESTHYEYDGDCIPFETFDAGTLGDVPITYPVSVHGPVIATATSEGRPVALTSKRSTFGRDGLNLAALKDMTEGDADTTDAFFESANKFGFTFNWGYVNRGGIGYFASGYLPVRAEGLDRRLPTLGTGEYDWQGFLDQDQHPQADGHPSGRLLNWNNQSAPGFMHGDGEQYGSVHRVEGFDQWPDQVDLAGTVGVMNRSATEDVRSTVWPVISAVLAEGESPSALASDAVDVLDDWVADDAPILDADDDGFNDSPGTLVYDEVFAAVVDAVRQPVLGEYLAAGGQLRGLDDAGFVDKDLRMVLGELVEGPFNVAYCGGGDLAACSDSLWTALDDAVAGLAAERGADISTWLSPGRRLTFAPGLIPDDFRATNRPTYQQLLEFASR
jgi:acyl-homoserine lactone acylase PvdQ